MIPYSLTAPDMQARSNPLVVRAAAPEDAPVLLALLAEFARFEGAAENFALSAEVLRQALSGASPSLLGHLALVGDTPAGCALGYLTFSSFQGSRRLFVEDLFVAAAGRGRGTGRALVGALARQARELGCDALHWRVLAWNRPAIEFYAALGAMPAHSHLQCVLTGNRLNVATRW